MELVNALAKNIGFIGCGNMARAIIRGILGHVGEAGRICAFDTYREGLLDFAKASGITPCESATEVLERSDMVIIAVKPNVMPLVLGELNPQLRPEKIVISIVAGWSTERISSALGHRRVLRVMPNTPLMVGQGMSVLSENHGLSANEFEQAKLIFDLAGKTAVLPERLFDAVTGISGSGPAYAYIFIEALSDAGVLFGLPRDVATKLAAQTVLGGAAMVLETGQHPGALKDAVCSPGGTTIEAVHSLEADGFRGAVMNAVEKCVKKAKMLST